MIQANELRIGNLVTVDNEKYHPKLKGIPLRITGINIRSFKGKETYAVGLEEIHQEEKVYYDSYSQWAEFIKPIPLTEEWLLKFGFDTIDDDGLFGSITEPLFQLQNRYLANDGFDFIFDTSIINSEENTVKYVHQLQNLYFALTGEELKIQ